MKTKEFSLKPIGKPLAGKHFRYDGLEHDKVLKSWQTENPHVKILNVFFEVPQDPLGSHDLRILVMYEGQEGK
jgi:hypothetical protein